MSLTALASQAKVWVPIHEHDIRNYRLIPLMPNVFLEKTTRYVMFVNEDGDYVLTMEAIMDNNNGGPIESDGIDGVGVDLPFVGVVQVHPRSPHAGDHRIFKNSAVGSGCFESNKAIAELEG